MNTRNPNSTGGQAPQLALGRTRRSFAWPVLRYLLLALLGFCSLSWAAGNTTYTKRVTIPVPPASSFTGNSGGDGWAIALTPDAVYNVYHHNYLYVACHLQVDASNCWDSPYKGIYDSDGGSFYVPNHPGLALYQKSGHLFVYVTRSSDYSRGVVCIDTTQPASVTNPFCGYTRLSNINDSGPTDASPGNGLLVGTRFYAFNSVDGVAVSGSQNRLMCFDIATETACAGQPYDLGFPANYGAGNGYNPAAVAGSKLIVPIIADTGSWVGCFDTSTSARCTGSWPVALASSYYYNGAPFPLLNAAGTATGFCLANGSGLCYDFSGAAAVSPSGLAAAMGTTTGYNGPAQTISARVYQASGNDNAVHCFDYATGSVCSNFPHALPNSGFTYTVNPDPQRPECLWTNADWGSAQIQNFDAFSGGACGKGAIRVLASSFVPPDVACVPVSYTKLQVIDPARAGYANGSVAFRDGSGNPIPGLSDASIDASGSVSLTGLNLNVNGLPQFLITLNSPTSEVGAVTVEMTWTGQNLKQCGGNPAVATKLTAYPSLVQVLPGVKLNLKLSAKLSDSSGLPLVGQSVVFRVGNRTICTASTIATGVASCKGKPVGTLASVLTLGYKADFMGAGDYLPSSSRGALLTIGNPK